jgi:superfamily I DNA and/or RNA helicase
MSLQQEQQDVIDAEAALIALGALSANNFNQAHQLLKKRKNAQDNINTIQSNQFHLDAFNLIDQIQNRATQTVVISQFLRTFAEYIATQTQALQGTHPTIKDIVDNIVPMGGEN